jgi:NitT/TauT family transport system substrate-binding protein
MMATLPKCIALLALAALLTGCATSDKAGNETPLAIYGNRQTFEIAPVLLASESYYPGESTVRMGSIANLVGEPPVPGFGEKGEADLATNAETQALRYSVRHPNLRIVMTVTEGLYRIVARRSAGIESVADLKGKRIATIAQTSSGYFLRLMLEKEGIAFEEIEDVPIVPLSGMTEALARREVDAVVIWEPENENAAQVLGDDLIVFDGHGIYRELFNLNSTAEKLADPATRTRIVRFIRAILDASAEIRRDPMRAQALVTEAGGFDRQDVEDSWEHHGWLAAVRDDLLDVLVKQEKWLAARDNRTARTREELSRLIDTSAYEEALALESDQAVLTKGISKGAGF